MRAIVYIRVSTDEQAEHGYSLAGQESACRDRALTLGADEVEVFSDPGFSGAFLDRPGLTAARGRLREGGVALFVCLDPDRLARNLAHQLLLTEEIEKAGARLEFVNFEWKDTPEGRLFYSLRGAIAEYEREKIKERTMRGRWAKALAGKVPSWCSIFGYRYDPETDSLEVDPAEADAVRHVFAWYVAEEVTLGEIARRLVALGVPAKRSGRVVWSPSHIRRILMQSAYAGVYYVRRYKGRGGHPGSLTRQRPREEWIPVPVPAILDMDTWVAAQRRLETAGRRRGSHDYAAYLLSGVIRCGACGRTMSGTRIRVGRGSTKVNRYYRCSRSWRTAWNPVPCIQRCHVRVEALDDLVWRTVAGWIEAPEALEASLRDLLPQGEAERMRREVEAIEARLAGLARGRAALMDLVRSGAILPSEARHELAQTRADIDSLRARRDELFTALSRATLADEDRRLLEDLRRDVGSALDMLDPAAKSRIVRLLLRDVVLYPDGRVTIVTRLGRQPAAAGGGMLTLPMRLA